MDDSEVSVNSMRENQIVKRRYYCKFCDETHSIEFNKDISKGQPRFPFSYVYVHIYTKNDEEKELLTILYLDNDCKIRGTDITELNNSDIYSKTHVEAKIAALDEENQKLKEEIKRLKEELIQLRNK